MNISSFLSRNIQFVRVTGAFAAGFAASELRGAEPRLGDKAKKPMPEVSMSKRLETIKVENDALRGSMTKEREFFNQARATSVDQSVSLNSSQKLFDSIEIGSAHEFLGIGALNDLRRLGYEIGYQQALQGQYEQAYVTWQKSIQLANICNEPNRAAENEIIQARWAAKALYGENYQNQSTLIKALQQIVDIALDKNTTLSPLLVWHAVEALFHLRALNGLPPAQAQNQLQLLKEKTGECFESYIRDPQNLGQAYVNFVQTEKPSAVILLNIRLHEYPEKALGDFLCSLNSQQTLKQEYTAEDAQQYARQIFDFVLAVIACSEVPKYQAELERAQVVLNGLPDVGAREEKRFVRMLMEGVSVN